MWASPLSTKRAGPASFRAMDFQWTQKGTGGADNRHECVIGEYCAVIRGRKSSIGATPTLTIYRGTEHVLTSTLSGVPTGKRFAERKLKELIAAVAVAA